MLFGGGGVKSPFQRVLKGILRGFAGGGFGGGGAKNGFFKEFREKGSRVWDYIMIFGHLGRL